MLKNRRANYRSVSLGDYQDAKTLVSRSQTAFSSFVFGREEKGSGERPI